MKSKAFKNYYIFSILITFIMSFYPLYMGICVVSDMITKGIVLGEDYPKYIIPYTPISLAIIVGVVLMPLVIKFTKKFSLLVASGFSLVVFFISELLLESQVIVTKTVSTTLESWQMFMCYISPELYETRTWKAVDVLLGEYNPAFKIHFYIISIVLILSFLNCFYGFANVIISGNRIRLKSLIMQAVSSVSFLALCIFACFTAFFRTGELQVSSVSAVLMSVFFIVFGVTMGIYTGSFLLNRKRWISIYVPAIVSATVTLIMYIGEMILLSGHLYRFGSGFLFDGLGDLVLAPVDLIIVIASGCICAVIMNILSKENRRILMK